jgi:molybdopterin molybdotransferase
LPTGADTVVPREDARREPDDHVSFHHAPRGVGAFVRRKGDDWAEGEELLAPGVRLGAGAVALAASCGAVDLAVFRAPRVALIATGDELIEPGTSLRPGTIRESNRLMLGGLARSLGALPVDLGIVPDDREATVRALDAALSLYALVLTIGGASVGERDFVRDALSALGSSPRFFGVAIKPGRPIAMALRERSDGGLSACIVLPGNPASALTGFHLFVAPAIRRLQGCARVDPPFLMAMLETDARAAPERRTYLRARLRSAEAGLSVLPLSRQASGSVRSNALANALIVLEAGERRARGERVRVEPLLGEGGWDATDADVPA